MIKRITFAKNYQFNTCFSKREISTLDPQEIQSSNTISIVSFKDSYYGGHQDFSLRGTVTRKDFRK